LGFTQNFHDYTPGDWIVGSAIGFQGFVLQACTTTKKIIYLYLSLSNNDEMPTFHLSDSRPIAKV
jgi:hypothetical protein